MVHMSDPNVRRSSWLWLLLVFLFFSFLLMDKGDIFSIGGDIVDYFKVVPLWFLAAGSVYLLVRFGFKKKLSASAIMFYWSAG